MLVSNNNLTLLRCGYMCAGTLVHIPRHLSRTSYNNKRYQLIIRYVFCNSGHMDLDYDDMRYMIYIDEGFLICIIPSTYLSHEATNRAFTAGFAVFTFIGFYCAFMVL